jgi:multisubunit Na+/H+ antiporter MnhB subunit
MLQVTGTRVLSGLEAAMARHVFWLFALATACFAVATVCMFVAYRREKAKAKGNPKVMARVQKRRAMLVGFAFATACFGLVLLLRLFEWLSPNWP